MVVGVEGSEDVIRCAREPEDVVLDSFDLQLPPLVEVAGLPVCRREIVAIVVRHGRLGLRLQINVVGYILRSARTGQGVDQGAHVREGNGCDSARELCLDI